MKHHKVDRRSFLRWGVTLATGSPFLLAARYPSLFAEDQPPAKPASTIPARTESKVAIVACKSYGPEVRASLQQCFDLLGGIGSLVKNKTVTVKINLTGTNFTDFMQRPVGETYMTHYSTALALGSLLFAAGARRVRFVESTTSRSPLPASLPTPHCDLKP